MCSKVFVFLSLNFEAMEGRGVADQDGHRCEPNLATFSIEHDRMDCDKF